MTAYRWLSDEDIVEWVNPECVRRGWVRFNVNESAPTCRVLGAFDGVELVGFFGFHLMPILGPMWVAQDQRNGVASLGMAEGMAKFMVEVQCRGALMVADNAATERMAERFGLRRVESPVFEWKGVGKEKG